MILYRVVNEFFPGEEPIRSIVATYDSFEMAERFVKKYGYLPEERDGRLIWRSPYDDPFPNYIWITEEEVKSDGEKR